MQYLKTLALAVIIIGSYLGVRYIGVVIHYGCTAPEEDGPPPLCLAGEFAYVVTGGPFVPLWTRN
jgi:hypothetical protein